MKNHRGKNQYFEAKGWETFQIKEPVKKPPVILVAGFPHPGDSPCVHLSSEIVYNRCENTQVVYLYN